MTKFVKIVIAMEKKVSLFYQRPQTEMFSVRIEDVICGTGQGKLRYTNNPGSAGDDILPEDIIDGGSF